MGGKLRQLGPILCVALGIALSPVRGLSETLRFVFLADSRGESLSEPINTPVLNTIIAQLEALSPRPAFVVFGGDMAYRAMSTARTCSRPGKISSHP